MKTKQIDAVKAQANKSSLAGKAAKLRYYNAFCYTDENGGFYSYGKCGEMTGEITIISKRYASRANAEHDLTCHVQNAHGLIPICWNQGTLEDINKAKAGCGEPLLPVPIPPKPKFIQKFMIEIKGEADGRAIGWGTLAMLEKFMTENKATTAFADEVERWYQTSLTGRTITVKEVK